MTIGSPSEKSTAWDVSVQASAQRQQRVEGAAATRLIEQAVPPVGPDGQGTRINTYG